MSLKKGRRELWFGERLWQTVGFQVAKGKRERVRFSVVKERESRRLEEEEGKV